MISVAITSPLTCETNDFPEVKIDELCKCSTSLVDQVNMTLATDFIPKFNLLTENKEKSQEDLFDNYFKYDFVKKSGIISSYVNPINFNKSTNSLYQKFGIGYDGINHHKLHNKNIEKSNSKPITKKFKDKVKAPLKVKKEKEYYLVNGSWKFHYPKKC
jgi:hypothetical protein